MKVIEISRNISLLRPTIVIIGYMREYHFTQVIESVTKLLGVENFNICIVVQKSLSQVLDIAERCTLINKTILLTDFENKISAKQKINSNIFTGLNFAFTECQSPYVVVIEDDTVLLRDSLLFFDLMHREYRSDEKFRGINAFSDYIYSRDETNLKNAYIKGNFGLGWGWSINGKVFSELREIWNGSENEHWDSLIEPFVRSGFVINPVRSRVINLGLDGTGTNSEKCLELFEAMKTSSELVQGHQRQYYEIKNFRPLNFWRTDYFILSGRSEKLVNFLLFAYNLNFRLSRKARQFPTLIFLRKIYSLHSKLLLKCTKDIVYFHKNFQNCSARVNI